MRDRLISLLFLAAAALACGCGASVAELERGRGGVEEWDRAVRYYEGALEENPDDMELLIALRHARLEAARAHVGRARAHLANDRLRMAARELERAVELDPTNRYVAEELALVRERLEDIEEEGPGPPLAQGPTGRLFGPEPVIDPDAPLDLRFAEGTSLRTILESLAKLAGVNILFDESYRDRRVSVELEGVTFRQALELLLTTNGLYYKVVGSRDVQVGNARER